VGWGEGLGDLERLVTNYFRDREGEMVRGYIPLYAERLPLVFVKPLLREGAVPERAVVCGASKRASLCSHNSPGSQI
jgi:hypothetical protein